MDANEKIGIITCSSATFEMDCCAAVCLRDMHQHLGEFKKHHTTPPILAGMITCAGCPTLAYPEKIIRKVKMLAEFGVRTIHFSYCMVALCPFLNKYIEMIGKAYPDIRLIKGTHESSNSDGQFRAYVNAACKDGLSMNELIQRMVADTK